ncbi:hypothetical protein DIS24_g3437 [Lasiodiplodia hormozganensis]|uniref:Alkylmercury lyase n=1 Tax=Lasiodiplodia hormozganensis TaxID=869390 RepID=A0AA40D2I9_9PEZI|nr:hypothetical protein DIS24_g3437 [Lasiodiplodia hormozganensis]
MTDCARSVRHFIFTFYLEHCRPPTTQEIATAGSFSADQVTDALRELETSHHIVLYKDGVPSPTPIAMAHPFSHLPTPFIVCQGKRSWWANCAWCAFGLASMLLAESTTPVKVIVRSGSIGDELLFQVSKAGIQLQGQEKDCVVHFSAPPSTWWVDVKFACGTIHVFKDKAEANDWCETHGFRHGAIMDLDTMWKLSKAWYEDKASYDYNRKTAEEKTELYEGLGMVSDFWTK